jgi:cytochrome c oxidase assembly protein subunit 15
MDDMIEQRQAAREGMPVAAWLFFCAAMVLAMMVIGAITRLTGSGLSMVEWRPLIGVLPPLAEAEWNRVFALYRETSQYRLANTGMSVAEFKTIFWWEYIHRLWGRLIGVVFALPFAVFLARGMVPHAMTGHLAALFLIGGAQGLIGWWMVKSGFAARSEVSQYRLTVHLGLAFTILGYLLWLALGIVAPGRSSPRRARRARRPRGLAMATLAAVFATALAGGLVAGLNAGLDYNTWPLMDGGLAPAGVLALSPWWLNAFENIATVQFDHRMLAYVTTLCIAWLWWRCRHAGPRTAMAATALGLMAVAQLGLGIATVLLAVPLPLAALHQAGAAVLFSLALWVAQSLSRSK